MRLCYRGVYYDYVTPTLEVTEGEIAGSYRGLGWREHTLKQLPVHQPSHYLKYRGVPYWTNQVANTGRVVEPRVAITEPGSTRRSRVRPFGVPTQSLTKRQRLAELATVHRASIEQSLNHRLTVARQRGDQNLVQLLEAEQRQMA